MAQKVYGSNGYATKVISVDDELELVCSLHKGKVGFKPREVYVWDLDKLDDDWWDDSCHQSDPRFVALWCTRSMLDAKAGEIWKVKIETQTISNKRDVRGNILVFHDVRPIERVTYETPRQFDRTSGTWNYKVMSGSVVLECKSVLGEIRRTRYATYTGSTISYEWDEFFMEVERKMVCIERRKVQLSILSTPDSNKQGRAIGKIERLMQQARRPPVTYPAFPDDGVPEVY